MDKKLSPQERKSQVVTAGAYELGDIEKALDNAARGFITLIDRAEDAYIAGILTGTQCNTIKGKLRRWAGLIGDIETEVYPFHGEMTELAKAQKCDVPVEYETLKGKKVTTKSGGGR